MKHAETNSSNIHILSILLNFIIISCHDYTNHELIIFPVQMLAAIYIAI